MKESFGAWLKRMRKERGLSQGRTCLLAGVSSMALFDAERDKTDPSEMTARVLYGLAVTLGVDPGDVLKRAAETDDFLREWWADPKRGEWR